MVQQQGQQADGRDAEKQVVGGEPGTSSSETELMQLQSSTSTSDSTAPAVQVGKLKIMGEDYAVAEGVNDAAEVRIPLQNGKCTTYNHYNHSNALHEIDIKRY